MELKWYWVAELLGLVKNVSAEYNDGAVHWQVSAAAGDVFFAFAMSMIPVMFFLGFLIHFIYRVKQKPQTGSKWVLIGTVALLAYALMLAVGIGPYIKFYPQGGGFLDLSTLEHLVEGLYMALLALMLFLGCKVSERMMKRGSKGYDGEV